MERENNISVNQRIAGYRKLAGFTQAQAAELLDLKRNTYARMEKHGNPSPEMLKKLSELYRVSVSDLLYGSDSIESIRQNIPPLVFEQPSYSDLLPLSNLETNAIRIFRNLSKENAKKIVDCFNEIYAQDKGK